MASGVGFARNRETAGLPNFVAYATKFGSDLGPIGSRQLLDGIEGAARRTLCCGQNDFDQGEVVFVGTGSASFFQEGKRGVYSSGISSRSFCEMVHEFLERQHRTIGPDDFVSAVAENKEAVERLQVNLAVGINAVRNRADGRTGRLEVLDLRVRPVWPGDQNGRRMPGAGV